MKNVLAGLGLGIAVGLLVAPGPGSTLRRQILGRAKRDEQRDEQGSSVLRILNSATREDLLSVYGLGSVIADQVVQNRPFASEQQLVDRNVVPESNFDHFKRQLQRGRTA
jgi:DNA uptake protein ComE-like DNA-binding protein